MKIFIFTSLFLATISCAAQTPTTIKVGATSEIVIDSITIYQFDAVFGKPTVEVMANGRIIMCHEIQNNETVIYSFEEYNSIGYIRKTFIKIDK
jgi:hypothetical protein